MGYISHSNYVISLIAYVVPIFQIVRYAFHLFRGNGLGGQVGNLLQQRLSLCAQFLNLSIGVGHQRCLRARKRVDQFFNIVFHLRE